MNRALAARVALGALAAGVLALTAPAANASQGLPASDGVCVTTGLQVSCTFGSTTADLSGRLVVPSGVRSVDMTVDGAAGGLGGGLRPGQGGLGYEVEATTLVKTGDVLLVHTGRVGRPAQTGGYGGEGNGDGGRGGQGAYIGGGGGGASSVTVAGGPSVVAGGGGGGGSGSQLAAGKNGQPAGAVTATSRGGNGSAQWGFGGGGGGGGHLGGRGGNSVGGGSAGESYASPGLTAGIRGALRGGQGRVTLRYTLP